MLGYVCVLWACMHVCVCKRARMHGCVCERLHKAIHEREFVHEQRLWSDAEIVCVCVFVFRVRLTLVKTALWRVRRQANVWSTPTTMLQKRCKKR